MYVNVAVLTETQEHERRVALVPSVALRLNKLGARLHMLAGTGVAIKIPDTAYKDVVIVSDLKTLLAGAEIVLAVQPPPPATIDMMKEGSVLISFIYENKDPAIVQHLLDRKITCFAMETVPRISRAQTMDALSSQSALAGYYAVQLGAVTLRRVLSKMSTAAGTIGPAKVLVMGLGVAGLEAAATAHRLGAAVEGYDVRPDTKAQIESLGAKFVDTGIDATGAGGYARALTDAEKAKVAGVLTDHIQHADLIITTAAIPGRPSPKLIDHAQVAGMKSGAVIVDLSAEGGGNCEDTKPGETTEIGLVTIVAPLNVPSLLNEDASELYAKNVYNLLTLMLKENVIVLDWSDEILAKTVLTYAGRHRRDATAQDAFPGSGKTSPADEHATRAA